MASGRLRSPGGDGVRRRGPAAGRWIYEARAVVVEVDLAVVAMMAAAAAAAAAVKCDGGGAGMDTAQSPVHSADNGYIRIPKTHQPESSS